MKKAFTLILLTTIMLAVLSGCGEEAVTKNTNSSNEYLRELENGKFYVLHKDQTFEEVYFGQATYSEGNIVTTPDPKRVMWYKDDYKKIPTLLAGDSLIYYTTDAFKEKFTFERFKDYGYTIGLCGLKKTDSGRYKISTKVEDKCTYPKGDTDVILNYSNDYVIIDKIGGIDLRDDNLETSDLIESGLITRSGTLKGLDCGKTYDAEIYEGTVKHTGLVFTADVHAFGSMEVTETKNFTFKEEENIIIIQIPEFFNSGYYAINGVGMFRYVNGGSYSDNTNFNMENDAPKDDPSNMTHTIKLSDNNHIATESTSTLEEMVSKDEELANTDDVSTTSFTVESSGYITINVTFDLANGLEEADGMPDVTGILTLPSGRSLKMKQDDNGLHLSLKAEELGEYTITYYDLAVRIPYVEINAD